MSDLIAPLIARIDSYLARTGMKPSRFGRNAAGNSMFLKRMKEGKVTLSTLQAVSDYLDRADRSEAKKKARKVK